MSSRAARGTKTQPEKGWIQMILLHPFRLSRSARCNFIEHLNNRKISDIISNKKIIYMIYMSRKLAVLAEVALALARNRQAPGPLETLKFSS